MSSRTAGEIGFFHRYKGTSSRIEKEFCASPMLIGGRIMTVEGEQEGMMPGPSTSNLHDEVTPASKLGNRYFDHQKMCYAPPRENGKSRIEICRTLLPVLDSPMSPQQHEKGAFVRHPTPLIQPTETKFHASYHVHTKTSARYVTLAAWFVAVQ